MKQNLLKLLLAAAVLALLFALAVPALADTDHTHSYTLVATRKEPTCTKAGTGLFRCECGAQEMRELPALGHAWGPWRTTKEATCTKNGARARTCARCGETETKTVKATGHSYEWKVTKKATCGASGSRQQVCKVCGAKGKTETVKATGQHTYEWKITRKATCGEAGSRQQVCKVCGAKGKTESIKATGKHTYEWQVTKEATCGEAGSRQQVCKVCGAKGKNGTVKATGKHTYEWQVTKEATCGEAGTRQQVCKVCGAQGKTGTVKATGKHTFGAWTVSQAASCEIAGQEQRACTVCGKTETRSIEALGHDWGQGVVTREAGYLEPGVKTYACARCGATRTEEIPVQTFKDGGVMDFFRGNTGISLMNKDVPLVILTQPVGGTVDWDGGSLTLSVEAAGGEAPYTYQWHMRYNSKMAAWRDVTDGTDSTVEAQKGRYWYYCTVYDDAGNHVDSEEVLVNWSLHIIKQPENTATCEMDPVILTCKASGGVPFTDAPDTYYYTWFDSDGNPVGYGPKFEVPGVGEYHMPKTGQYLCEAEDAAGNTVTSKAVYVYEADPFEAKTDAEVVELLDGQDYELWARAYGGIESYIGVWLQDGVEIPTQQVADGEFTAAIVGDGSKEVVYTFMATDAMKDKASCTVTVRYPQLKIAQQPQDGVLLTDGKTPVEVNVVMAEGEEPFTYYLYHNGEPKEFGQATGMSGGFNVWESGEYYIHIEDAAGRWADSDVAVVTDYTFKIDHIAVSGDLASPDDLVRLTAVTTGPAVWYKWWFEGERNGYVISDTMIAEGTDASYTVHAPGLYKCFAYDSQGQIANQSVRVNYTGTEPIPPIIIHQPQNAIGAYDESKPNRVSASFTCLAVTWDGSQDLSYQWQDKSLQYGQWVNRWKGQRLAGTYTVGTAVRCIVTDTRTGKQTISEEATVNLSLYGEITHIADYGGKDEYVKIDYIIKGGKAPYKVKFFADRIVGGDYDSPQRTSYMVDRATVQDNVEHTQLVPGGRYYTVYFLEGDREDFYIKKGFYLDYYLEITDANNNTFTSVSRNQ